MRSLQQQEIKRNTQVDKLILQWKTPQNKDKVLLLVEGFQDIEFYNRFFSIITKIKFNIIYCF